MRKNAILRILFLLPLFAIVAVAQEPPPKTAPNDNKAAVEHVLRTQQEAWNHHDLDAFMTGYWKSPELTFFSGANETARLAGDDGSLQGYLSESRA